MSTILFLPFPTSLHPHICLKLKEALNILGTGPTIKVLRSFDSPVNIEVGTFVPRNAYLLYKLLSFARYIFERQVYLPNKSF